MENIVPILATVLTVILTGFFAIQGGRIGRSMQSKWSAVALGGLFMLAVLPLKLLAEPAYPELAQYIQALCFWTLFFGGGIVAALKQKVENGK